SVGDCWLMSALSALIQRDEDIIKSLFITNQKSANGKYQIRLCKDGVWITVVIDDFLPCKIGCLHYAEVERKQMWLPLLEKAAAKLYGCYEGLDYGLRYEAFGLLTDAPCETVYIQRTSYADDFDADAIWLRLLANGKCLYPMVASCGTNGMNVEEIEYQRTGLSSNHIYAVLDVREIDGHRLIQLRDPYGSTTWKGDWSNRSDLWTPSLKTRLLQNDAKGEAFWISFKDILKYFFVFGVCKIRDGWTNTRFTGTFPVETQELSGVSFVVPEPMEIDFVLYQENQRYMEPAKRRQMDISLAIFRKVSSCPPGYEIVGFSNRTLHPVLYYTQTLDCGEYMIVPMSFNRWSLDNVKDPSYRVVLHSKWDVSARMERLSDWTVRNIMISIVRKYGKVTHHLAEKFRVYILSRLFCGIAVLVENDCTNHHVHFNFDTTDGFNIVSSRGDAQLTVDSLPPQHGQIVGIYTQRNSEEAFSSSYRYVCTLSSDSKLGDLHVPDTKIKDNTLHSVYPLCTS
ncbi:hypothetical protein ILUMI_13981, partial [Ignelater luminosus]